MVSLVLNFALILLYILLIYTALHISGTLVWSADLNSLELRFFMTTRSEGVIRLGRELYFSMLHPGGHHCLAGEQISPPHTALVVQFFSSCTPGTQDLRVL